MSEHAGLFAPPRHPVLSLAVQAQTTSPARIQTRFEVLVRHILHRFFHNELLASDDETKRVMQIAAAVALPTLIVSLFLFPAYHAFPPAPLHRPFWSQAGDHSFYVVYSFVVMGAVTVYEWDLLFPDILDIFVLSVLPIPSRKLFFARVLALAIFLLLVQLGTSILGTLFFPLAAEQHNFLRHLFSHFVAVTISGIFAATTFLSIQGTFATIDTTSGAHLPSTTSSLGSGFATPLAWRWNMHENRDCDALHPGGARCRPSDFSFEPVAPTARLSWSAVRCGRALSNTATTSKSRSVISARDVMSEMWNKISRASLSASCFALFTSARLRSEAVT